MAGRLDFLEKLNSEKFLIGYDLGNKYSQISYCPYGASTPETISMVAGSEIYNIPTVLCKRKGMNQWFYGKEAMKQASEGDGTLVEGLITLAKDGESVLVEGEEFDPIALLALYIKRSLALVSMVASLDKVGGIMFTCDNLDRRMVEVLNKAVANLGIKTQNIYFQGHVESIYSYNIYQPMNLWQHQVLVTEYGEEGIKTYRMECNRRTTPNVVFIDEETHPFRSFSTVPADEQQKQRVYEDMDQKFLSLMEEVCDGRLISSIYLIGDDFTDNWMKETLKFLCKNRRVFQGNNLYSKGACYSILEKMIMSEMGKQHVFLGNEKLKANIGMKVVRRGIDSYFALLDAGVNWFEANNEFEFILESGDSFMVLVTPLNGKDVEMVEVNLNGLPARPERTTRLYLQVDMISENKVQLRIEDKGFGEIFPATHTKWREILEL